MNKTDEMVLTFSADALKSIGMDGKTGFQATGHKEFMGSKPYLSTLSFVRRQDAETDESRKQMIPYWIVVDPSCEKILCYVRGKKSGENRLVKKASIGIGGHISLEDALGNGAKWNSPDVDHGLAWALYTVGAERELREEIKIGCGYDSSIVGLLNDHDTPVGRVHFGVVHVVVPYDHNAFGPNEADIITQFSWKTVPELETMRDSLEGWSKICLDNIGVILDEAKRTIQWRSDVIKG